jgi:hypothetical protein
MARSDEMKPTKEAKAAAKLCGELWDGVIPQKVLKQEFELVIATIEKLGYRWDSENWTLIEPWWVDKCRRK